MKDAAMLLNETLQEEIKTDQLLTKLAISWSTKKRRDGPSQSDGRLSTI